MVSSSITSPWSRCRWRWSAKHYILAALLGALVTIAAAAAISISLAPAHISFSIANATADLNSRDYVFTLVANNPSRRTAVSYGSVSAKIWYSATAWIPAEGNTTTTEVLPPWQRPRSVAQIPVWAESGQHDETNNGTSGDDKHPDSGREENTRRCKVLVEAKVWFKRGLAMTRPYTITASCPNVSFVLAAYGGAVEDNPEETTNPTIECRSG